MNHDFDNLINAKTPIISEVDLRQYAVTIPLLEDGSILFEVRSENIRHQPGDVCFPGGAIEKDESPEQAAIREMKEELLVNENQISMSGKLCLFTSGSVLIHVFLCRLSDYAQTFCSEEVAEVFRVPASYFLQTDPEIHEMAWVPSFEPDFPFDRIYGGRNYRWRDIRTPVRFYQYDGHVIWGFTARILSFFSESCRKRGISAIDPFGDKSQKHC